MLHSPTAKLKYFSQKENEISGLNLTNKSLISDCFLQETLDWGKGMATEKNRVGNHCPLVGDGRTGEEDSQNERVQKHTFTLQSCKGIMRDNMGPGGN